MSAIQQLFSEYINIKEKIKNLNQEKIELIKDITEKENKLKDFIITEKRKNNITDETGIQYRGYILYLKDSHKSMCKKKKDKISSIIEILNMKGIRINEDIANDILESQKGEKFEKKSLKIISSE